jgi:hypothetical protein
MLVQSGSRNLLDVEIENWREMPLEIGLCTLPNTESNTFMHESSSLIPYEQLIFVCSRIPHMLIGLIDIHSISIADGLSSEETCAIGNACWTNSKMAN